MISTEAFYWNIEQIEDRNVKHSVLDLLDDDLDIEGKLTIARNIFGKGHRVAECLIMDHFVHGNWLERFGRRNYLEVFSDLLLQAARRELTFPPLEGQTISGSTIPEANYASSVHVLGFIGLEEDIPLVLKRLKGSHSPEVVVEAIRTLDFLLEGKSDLHLEAILFLEQVLTSRDEKFGTEEKFSAISALIGYCHPLSDQLLQKLSSKLEPFLRSYLLAKVLEKNSKDVAWESFVLNELRNFRGYSGSKVFLNEIMDYFEME
jgi:hypothetical protein